MSTHPIDKYRAGKDMEVKRLYARLAAGVSAGERRHLHGAIIAARYGCGPSQKWESIVTSDGEPRAGTIDRAPRPHRIHRLKPRCGDPLASVEWLCRTTERQGREQHRFSTRAEWTAAVDRVVCTRLSMEIEGCRRAIWLYLLWCDQDVTGLRDGWYHWDEFMSRDQWVAFGRPALNHTDYWKWAWRLYTDGEALDRLIQYYRGLLVARYQRRGDTKITSPMEAEKFYHAAMAMISRMAGEEVAV